MGKNKKPKAGWGSSSNMWRDPKTVKGGGCAVVALGALGAVVGLAAGAAQLLG